MPVLRLKRGWLVLTGFATASVSFMLVYWQDFLDSSRWNSEKILVLVDFPAYGRLMVVDRMVGLWSAAPSSLLMANVTLGAVAVLTMAWGVMWGRQLSTRSLVPPVLALGGSTVFLAAVLVAGFGFMYKGAFLLMAVPLLALPRRKGAAFGLYTSLFALLCTAFAVSVGYNSLLTTLSGVTAACIALGGSLTLVARSILPTRTG